MYGERNNNKTHLQPYIIGKSPSIHMLYKHLALVITNIIKRYIINVENILLNLQYTLSKRRNINTHHLHKRDTWIVLPTFASSSLVPPVSLLVCPLLYAICIKYNIYCILFYSLLIIFMMIYCSLEMHAPFWVGEMVDQEMAVRFEI